MRKLLAIRSAVRVYLGYHARLRAQVRVQVFPAAFVEAHEDYVRRLFQQAARTLALHSRHVVSLLDLGRRRDCAFILTDYQPSDVRALLNAKGPLPVHRALALAEETLLGLEAVGQAGFAHGNVTPDGMLLGHDGSVRLDHLGTALRPDEMDRLTLGPDGTVSGPAFYAAPERVRSEQQADILSDLYALGCTLHEMLAGRPPFEGTTGQEVLRAQCGSRPPDLRAVRQDVPQEVSAFVSRLLAKEREGRPQSPSEALEELRALGVEVSRRGAMPAVEGALGPAERKRSALRWGLGWSLFAALLVVLSVVPGVLMCRPRSPGASGQGGPPRQVQALVRPFDAAPGQELPPDTERAVRALIAYRLAFVPELDVVWTAAPDAQVAPCALIAAYSPGVGRLRWTLVLSRSGRGGWFVRTDCAVDEGAPGGLKPLEEALDGLLSRAAPRLGLSPPDPLPPSGASGTAWALMARAVEGERAGRWEAALDEAHSALADSPQSAPAAFLWRFYEAVTALRAGKPVPAEAAMPPGGLPPEMAAIAGLLGAMAAGPPDAPPERFAELLAAHPRSARGYLLLGLWRLHAEGRAEEAAVAFRHAWDLDTGYVAAVRAFLEQTAGRDDAAADALLAQVSARTPDAATEAKAYAAELRARRRPAAAPQ